MEWLIRLFNKKRGRDAYRTTNIKDAAHLIRDLDTFGQPATHMFIEYGHLDHHIFVRSITSTIESFDEVNGKWDLKVRIEFIHAYPTSFWGKLMNQDRCIHLDHLEFIANDYGVRLVDKDDNSNDPAGYFPHLQNGQWHIVHDERYPQTDEERDLVVNSAVNMIGSGGYHIRNNNCEHLVTSLMLGLPFSHQSGVVPK